MVLCYVCITVSLILHVTMHLTILLVLIFATEDIWAFTSPSLFKFRTTSSSSSSSSSSFSSCIFGTNKLDGNVIHGDLVPLSNNLLVKVRAPMDATKGGLFIPDNAKERPTEGEVVSVGPGRVHPETGLLFGPQLKQGDMVMYGKFDGSELKYNDRDHQLIKESDVLLAYSSEGVGEATEDSVRCIADSILVKLPPKEDTNMNGIIVTTSSDDRKPDSGQVVRMGPGRQLQSGVVVPPSVSIGDMIRFRGFAGVQIKLGAGGGAGKGGLYVVIKDHDVMVKWKGAADK